MLGLLSELGLGLGLGLGWDRFTREPSAHPTPPLTSARPRPYPNHNLYPNPSPNPSPNPQLSTLDLEPSLNQAAALAPGDLMAVGSFRLKA